MKEFLCVEDIERLAAQGTREIVIGEHKVLTDLARARAQELRLSLVSSPRHESGTRPSLPAAPVQGKPKGCQHGPLPRATSGASRAASGDDPVVDELVGLVRRLRDEG